ncbi:hypothetical protein E3N88_05951 [Mikania micrantha]|uniref:Uncharacterized protein n=1 Tax=Mikania micrantha TaxID=192012 RepID=A0A5N6PP89_9ASTR|nr:hypothetical protein E3N88_05951 [Mikania micrantha]
MASAKGGNYKSVLNIHRFSQCNKNVLLGSAKVQSQRVFFNDSLPAKTTKSNKNGQETNAQGTRFELGLQAVKASIGCLLKAVRAETSLEEQ